MRNIHVVFLVTLTVNAACSHLVASEDEATKNYKAAKIFADELWVPGSAEHAAAFRGALRISSQITGLSPTQSQLARALQQENDLGLLANDPRYQQHLIEGTLVELQKKSPVTDRIWGGRPTRPGEFEATVALKGDRFVCSGTYLGSKRILTAAHCLCDENGGLRKDPIRRVVFGDTPAFSVHIFPIDKERTISTSKCPVKYEEGDAALLVLKDEPALDIAPITLANTQEIDATAVAYLVGYGESEEPGFSGAAGVRRRVAGAHVATKDCKRETTTSPSFFESDKRRYGCVEGMELVAGETGSNIDTCGGDSGGSVFIRTSRPNSSGKTIEGDWRLIAITSRRVTPGRRCGDGGIYVRVDGQIGSWILSHFND